MDENILKTLELKQYLDDQTTSLSQIQQIASGEISALPSSIATTTAQSMNLCTTTTSGVISPKPYYKVDDAALFMDNKLKISAFNVYTICTDDSMHKIDDNSAISSSYAITEYFNVMYYNNLLTPGYKCNYAINDTKNVVKHLNFFKQTFENIVQHKSSFPIGRIARKWENLHKALA